MNAGRSERNPSPVETATTLGAEIDTLLKDWGLRRRRTCAAKRAWASVASGELVEQCSVYVANEHVIVSCPDGVVFERALRIRQTFWRAVLREFRGLNTPLDVRVIRAEVCR